MKVATSHTQTGLTIAEAKRTITHVTYYDSIVKLTGRNGYTYEDGESPWWEHSDLGPTVCIICTDGYYYAEHEGR